MTNPRDVRPRWRLCLLGGFRLFSSDRLVDLPAAESHLVAYLAIQPYPTTRARLAGIMWPDVAQARALANVRTALSHLRKTGLPLVSTRETVRLHDVVAIDLDLVRDLALHPPQEEPSESAISLLLAGDMLPDWDLEWIEPERERYRQLRLHLLESLCARFSSLREFARALDLCTVAVAEAPLRETAQRQLIQVHLAEGNRAEAIRQFEAYRRVLDEELGLDASPEIVHLIDEASLLSSVDKRGSGG